MIAWSAVQRLEAIKGSLTAVYKEIAKAHAQNQASRLLADFSGVEKIAASVVVARMHDPHLFKSGRDFVARLDITPGKTLTVTTKNLTASPKAGDHFVGRLLGFNTVKRICLPNVGLWIWPNNENE